MLDISQETRVKITTGLLVSLCCAAVVFGWRGSELLSRIDTRISKVEQDRYSLTAASEQALRMAIENPGLGVPDPRDPNRIIVVKPQDRVPTYKGPSNVP